MGERFLGYIFHHSTALKFYEAYWELSREFHTNSVVGAIKPGQVFRVAISGLFPTFLMLYFPTFLVPVSSKNMGEGDKINIFKDLTHQTLSPSAAIFVQQSLYSPK